MKRRINESNKLKPLKISIIHYGGHKIWDNVECDELIDTNDNRIKLDEIDLNNIGEYFAFGRYETTRYCTLGQNYKVVINDNIEIIITPEYYTTNRRFTDDLVIVVVNAYNDLNSVDHEEPDSDMSDIF